MLFLTRLFLSFGAVKLGLKAQGPAKGHLQVGLQVASGPQATVGDLQALEVVQVLPPVLVLVLTGALPRLSVAIRVKGSQGPQRGIFK